MNKVITVNNIKEHKTKKRSISYLYSLWLLTTVRKDRYYNQLNNYIDEIVKQIPPTETSQGDTIYIIYYKCRINENRLRKIEIKYDEFHKCYTRAYTGWVGDNDDIRNRRNEIVDLIISEDIRLEMGEKYRRLDILSDTGLSYIVFDQMWSIISKSLIDMKINDEIFIISICGDKYFVRNTKPNQYTPSYRLLNRVDNNIIEF